MVSPAMEFASPEQSLGKALINQLITPVHLNPMCRETLVQPVCWFELGREIRALAIETSNLSHDDHAA